MAGVSEDSTKHLMDLKVELNKIGRVLKTAIDALIKLNEKLNEIY